MINWNFTARPPTGGPPRIIPRALTFVDGSQGRGIRARLTPDGDCVEMTFDAIGRDLALLPLTALQLNVDVGGTTVPLFLGEIRQGGNLRDVEGQTYTVRGLSARLGEVTLSPGFSTPAQPAHLTVRAAIQDVIASGQLGSPTLIIYDEALCPDLGFDCRRVVDAMQQSPAALLTQIAADGAALGVQVRWGVRPDGRFFCQVARTTVRDVTLEAPFVEWKAPVAETPCTAVLWFVARRPDGTWLTHRSRSPEADVYGDRVLKLSVQGNIYPWETLPVTAGVKGVAGQAPIPLTSTEVTRLTDELTAPPGSRPSPVFTPDSATSSEHLYIQVTTDAAQRVALRGSSNYGRDVLITADGTQIAEYPGAAGTLNEFRATIYTTGTVFRAEAEEADTSAATGGTSQFQMFELRAERIDTDLLDGLARSAYRSPAMEPADIETDTFVPPGSLPGRVRLTPLDGPVYEHALEAVEYRLTDDGLLMGWLTGQADDPAALVQAALIRRSDSEAVITAVTATT